VTMQLAPCDDATDRSHTPLKQRQSPVFTTTPAAAAAAAAASAVVAKLPSPPAPQFTGLCRHSWCRQVGLLRRRDGRRESSSSSVSAAPLLCLRSRRGAVHTARGYSRTRYVVVELSNNNGDVCATRVV